MLVKVASAINVNTDFVVYGSGAGSKLLDQAEARGVQLITEEEFVELAQGGGGSNKKPAAKKGKAKTEASNSEAPESEEESEEEAPPKKKLAAKAAPKKGTKQAANHGEDEEEDDAPPAKPAKKVSAKKSKVEKGEDENASNSTNTPTRFSELMSNAQSTAQEEHLRARISQLEEEERNLNAQIIVPGVSKQDILALRTQISETKSDLIATKYLLTAELRRLSQEPKIKKKSITAMTLRCPEDTLPGGVHVGRKAFDKFFNNEVMEFLNRDTSKRLTPQNS
eukprot:PhF_6_TR36633/c0_g2_i1/m.54044